MLGSFQVLLLLHIVGGGTGITASEIEQAEEFNGQFTDVFNKSNHSEVPFLSRSAPFMDDIVVSNV